MSSRIKTLRAAEARAAVVAEKQVAKGEEIKKALNTHANARRSLVVT